MSVDFQHKDRIEPTENMMKTIQLITKIIGLLIVISGVNSSFAEKIQVNTTFTCRTNAECKGKCEALGGRWKSNPGGATRGTCTIPPSLAGDNKIKPYPPAKAELDSLSVVTQNAQAIHKELNVLFSKSHIAKELKLEGVQIDSISIVLKNNNEKDICASCLGDGFSTELCCSSKVPNCNDPCRDGDYVPSMLFAK